MVERCRGPSNNSHEFLEALRSRDAGIAQNGLAVRTALLIITASAEAVAVLTLLLHRNTSLRRSRPACSCLRLCRKQGPQMAARPNRLLGRGWPRLAAARGRF